MSLFSERLREAINNSGLSQAEVARRAGIGRSSITYYLQDKYEAKQQYVTALARALNVNEGWLLGWTNKKTGYTNNPNNNSEEVSSKSLDEMAEEYSKQFRSYGDKPISEEQRKAIKEITLAYLKSQGINDSSEDQ